MRDWSLAEAHGTTREVLTLYATVSRLIATPEPVSASRLLGQAARNATANGNNKRKLGRLSVVSQSGICLGLVGPSSHSGPPGFLISWRARSAQSLWAKVHLWRAKWVLHVTVGNIPPPIFLVIEMEMVLWATTWAPAWLIVIHVVLDSNPKAMTTPHLSLIFVSQLAKDNTLCGRA